MDLDEAHRIVAEQHRAVLGTLRAGGEPQLSPVLITTGGPGVLAVSTRAGAAKVRNLRRHPRAWVCVLPEAFFGRWIQVDCDAEVVDQPEALPLLEDYYRSISGEHEDWDAYREAMRSEDRVLLRLTPTRAVG
ncbi:PPOX class F420-dependent oxidoreductase [Saccharopolyspora cebuensis]|uniref:PPOX class F420-dependent oxidoreductase n=1 Tax=Saccharopolyspora cebuensis TaxID=418759 RepID=A0ABV4CQ53_9PSEU